MHQRLHAHAGFAAIEDGSIDLPRYLRLLVRLYGFHAAFDAAGEGGQRSAWLRQDLRSFGLSEASLAACPACPDVPGFSTAGARLGARYVVEGAALGGCLLARRLDGLLGPGVTAGRCFLAGRGAGTGQTWRDYLAQLAAAPDTAVARTEIVGAALQTFAAFEDWLAGWNNLAVPNVA